MVDWTKPIQFEDGRPCEYFGIWEDGAGEFRQTVIVDGTCLFWVRDDGTTPRSGWNVINVSED